MNVAFGTSCHNIKFLILPFTIIFVIVADFARKTGDYQSLSAVDIRVLALAYQLTKEFVGTDHLKKEPEKKVILICSVMNGFQT